MTLSGLKRLLFSKRINGPGKRINGPTDAVAVWQHRYAAIRAKYDAAQTTDDNTRHWANADSLSADAGATPAIRRTLRNRSRYEAANNSYCRGMVLTLANDTIGTGPRLQIRTGKPEADVVIEKEISDWFQAVCLAERLRVARMAKAVDGETFMQFFTNPKLNHSVQLDFRVIEAEEISTPDLDVMNDNAVDGIRFDQYGNPIEYHRLKSHPGSYSVTGIMDYDTIPAADMIHLMHANRPGQHRGIPELVPALPLFAQLRRYTLAVIAAAETAAEFAGVMYTDSPALDSPDEFGSLDPVELEMRALLTLPMGWKMAQVKAEQPATTYDVFVRAILKEIARCLNMPFNVAAGDSSDYNYASGRLDHQTYFKAIAVERHYCEVNALDSILWSWMDEALLIPGFLPSDLPPFDRWTHQWMWDSHEHVDPVKEAQAQKLRLASHTTTLADEYGRQGKDWETSLRQRAKEIELITELGMTNSQPNPEPSRTASNQERQDAPA